MNKTDNPTPTPPSSAPPLPNSERDRIRFLIKMLKQTVKTEPTDLAFKKALQILLSLNKIIKDHKLNKISSLTETLEAVLNTRISSETPKKWPALSTSLELLESFANEPWTFDSSLLSEAIVEMSEPTSEEKQEVPNNDSFRQEILHQTHQLKEILNQASVDGSLHKRRLQDCLSSLNKAIRTSDWPTAETLFESLKVALTRYAEAEKAPASLLARAAEAVELLAQEATALMQDKPGLASWKAANIVERLESSVEDLESVPQKAKSTMVILASDSKSHAKPAPPVDLVQWTEAGERLRQAWARSPDSELKEEVERFLVIHGANLYSLQRSGQTS